MAKLHFLGANRQVTGSRYCLETSKHRVLVDCGMFQERAFQSRNWDECPIPADSIDAVVITHAHIDHTGLLPRLVRQGYSGPIFATSPTVDLLDIMLLDAAHIQAEDLKYKQKRHKKQGKTSPYPYEPLFDESDAGNTLKKLVGVAYETPREVIEGVTVKFHEAGHILGSSSLEFTVEDEGETRTIVFSGDIGQNDKPLIRDPKPVSNADYLVLESTYGDREHRDAGDIGTQLEKIVNETFEQNGKVIIPTFAVERAQELMYYISRLVHEDKIPDVPVYLDSPMAIDVTETFRKHRDAYDEETWELINADVPPLRFPGLTMSRTVDQSKAISGVKGPAIVMSTSGMCTAGRIKHHLKNYITKAKNTILFVGYQGRGTLGRLIMEGKEEIRIHGKEHKVRARIAQIFGFSGHADRSGLLDWTEAISPAPKRTFLTHGEEESALSLADALREKGWDVDVPDYHSTTDLA